MRKLRLSEGTGLAQGQRQGFLGFSPELSQFTARSVTPTLEYSAAAEMPRSWLGAGNGQKCVYLPRFSRLERKVCQVFSMNNAPMNRAISRLQWGLGGRGGKNQMFPPHGLQSNAGAFGQHTCFLSSEHAGFQFSPPGRGISSPYLCSV